VAFLYLDCGTCLLPAPGPRKSAQLGDCDICIGAQIPGMRIRWLDRTERTPPVICGRR
jgi:hypothetical protein